MLAALHGLSALPMVVSITAGEKDVSCFEGACRSGAGRELTVS